MPSLVTAVAWLCLGPCLILGLPHNERLTLTSPHAQGLLGSTLASSDVFGPPDGAIGSGQSVREKLAQAAASRSARDKQSAKSRPSPPTTSEAAVIGQLSPDAFGPFFDGSFFSAQSSDSSASKGSQATASETTDTTAAANTKITSAENQSTLTTAASAQGLNTQGAGAAIVASAVTQASVIQISSSTSASQTDSQAIGRNTQGAGVAIFTSASTRAPLAGGSASQRDVASSISDSSFATAAAASSLTSSFTQEPGATAEAAQASSTVFQLPGRQLAVLPIGLGIFAGISVIALVVRRFALGRSLFIVWQIVGVVTYERRKYRKQYRLRKQREQIAGAGGFGDMAWVDYHSVPNSRC